MHEVWDPVSYFITRNPNRLTLYLLRAKQLLGAGAPIQKLVKQGVEAILLGETTTVLGGVLGGENGSDRN